MKARFLVLLLMLATLTSQKALAQNFPLKARTFSSTVTGSLAICLNPTTFALEACTTKGVLVAPLTVLSVGRGVGDAKGNACSSVVETDSDFPVDASPPLVTKNEHVVAKLTTYDPTTGVGDGTSTTYTGSVRGPRLTAPERLWHPPAHFTMLSPRMAIGLISSLPV